MHPVTAATIKALRAFVFPAYGRKSKPPALRVVVDSVPGVPGSFSAQVFDRSGKACQGRQGLKRGANTGASMKNFRDTGLLILAGGRRR